MTQLLDLDAAIAQAVEAERQAQETEEAEKQQRAADEDLRQRTYLQERLNQDLATEIQQQLGLEIKKLTFGYVGAFQLIDELDNFVEGYISAETRGGRADGWNIRLPNLNRVPGQRTFHSDGSGGVHTFYERQELQQKLLYTLGIWREKVTELKVQVQKQAERNRQLAEERKAEQQRQAVEREQREAEQAALQQRLQELHKQIKPQVNLLIEQCRWQWPQGKILKVYQWEWCKGHFTGEFGDGGEYDQAYGLVDSLDDKGYFTTATGDRIKLIPSVHKPVVRELRWGSMEDLPANLHETQHLNINGVTWRGGLIRYAADNCIPHSQTVPVPWVRKALGVELVQAATINPPDNFDPTQFSLEDDDYDSIPF